ncbi:uncharacterized protein [Argopecten irradians]|uniref:uncharacterized protein n=1 Tax=Argopecten irradians TaxID=31199 RepID=UPI0037233F13
MIGAKTGKIIGLQIRSKNCRICSKAKERCIPARVHSCRKNWSGSSKAMEGDMIVQITKDIESQKACIRTVVGNEDATTISKLHKEISPDIEKRSDSNHLRKILGNELYTIKQTNQISAKTIKYLQKNFNYMCQQNKQNPEGIQQGLDALSMQPFNDHSKCDEAWCKHVKTPSIKYNSLPYGKPLTDKKFQNSLQNIFEKYKKQADKLAFASSTQSNENFNNIVASKAPKNHHTSGSESLDYRVNAAASQKNTGYTYLVDVSYDRVMHR